MIHGTCIEEGSLIEKCPNTEFFRVRVWTLFMQWLCSVTAASKALTATSGVRFECPKNSRILQANQFHNQLELKNDTVKPFIVVKRGSTTTWVK